MDHHYGHHFVGSDTDDPEDEDELQDFLADKWELLYEKTGTLNFGLNHRYLWHYVVEGRCHEWNPIFGLKLAKMLFPRNKWVIRSSTEHTTVYCEELHMVFDILYWAATADRVKDYYFGRQNIKRGHLTKPDFRYSDSDSTLGGEQAFLDSAERPEKKRTGKKIKTPKSN